jgi:inner membrane protein
MIEYTFFRSELFWFILGLVLFLLELVIPGFFIFFFGLGAWITALVCLFSEPGLNVQIIIFAFTSVITLSVLRRMIRQKFFFNRGSESESIEDEFTGREAIAKSDFGGNKTGKVEFKGTIWKAESKFEIREGQTVIIIEKENIKLLVEPKNY